MRFCFIHNLWGKEARGGAEQVLSEIISYLLKQGHIVTLITTTTVQQERIEEHNNLTIYYLPSAYSRLVTWPQWQRFFYHFWQTINFSTYHRIKEIITTEKPDMIWTHNILGFGFKVLRLGQALGIKHFHTLHDIQLLHPSGLLLYGHEAMINSLPAKLYQFLIKRSLPSSLLIISPSQWLLALYKEQKFFVNNTTRILPNPSVKKSEAYQRTSKEQVGITFLYVGQIEKHKGITNLVEAFSMINEPQWRLIIAGDGSLLADLKVQNKDQRIVYRGRQDHKTVLELMDQADCLVVPSLCYENFPTVILEAMSIGLLVIGSALGGIKELLVDESLLFQPDTDAIKERLEWVGEHFETLVTKTQDRYTVITPMTLVEYCRELDL